MVGKSFINAPSKVLSQGTEEINRTTLKTHDLELLQAIAASTDVLPMALKYSEKKKVERRKWLFKLRMQQRLENNPQIPLSHLPKSCILSNLKTILYDTANMGMYCKHPGLKVTSFTEGTWSHPSPMTPGKWFRAQHVEVREFTAHTHTHSWFTIVEIEKEIGRWKNTKS